jgi:hypothetical protein
MSHIDSVNEGLAIYSIKEIQCNSFVFNGLRFRLIVWHAECEEAWQETVRTPVLETITNFQRVELI